MKVLDLKGQTKVSTNTPADLWVLLNIAIRQMGRYNELYNNTKTDEERRVILNKNKELQNKAIKIESKLIQMLNEYQG